MKNNPLYRISKVILIAWCGLALSWSHLRAAESSLPRSFVSGSFSEILASKQSRPLILIFWSVECSSCIKELGLLADLRANRPNLDFVMVSTDGIDRADQAAQLLAEHNIGDVEAWIFAESHAPRLRYEVDPKWYGELPRTYLYDAAHRRVGFSGVPDPQKIQSWMASL